MRVALVIEHMDPARGGRERSTAEVARALARRGCRVTVLCQTASWAAPGVGVRPLAARGFSRFARLRSFVAQVQAEIAGPAYDIVHTTLPLAGANIYQLRSGTLAARREVRRRRAMRLPGAEWVRARNRCQRYLSGMERQVVTGRDSLCVAVSQLVAEELDRHYGRRDDVRVIYNAVEMRRPDSGRWRQWRERQRAQLGIRPHQPLFITVATNFELKGVAETITAFARWQQTRPRLDRPQLLVVGRNRPWRYQLLAKRLGVAENVAFLPPTDQVQHWYAAADACVLLSWYDPCSRVVLEATSMGVPSITTAFNGAAESLQGGAGMVVASPRDLPAVVAAMDDLADPANRKARQLACRSVAGGLTTERHVEQLMMAYDDVLGRAAKSTYVRLGVVFGKDEWQRAKAVASDGQMALDVGDGKKAA